MSTKALHAKVITGNKKKSKVKLYTKNVKAKQPESKLIEELQVKYENIDVSGITKFTDFPLSSKTLKGLKECGYIKPTEIQRETILLGVQGKDVLGAAQTGSGKTVAFLVPLLEVLYCKQWTHLDGIGALVITPTRELAYQIFECLRKVGKYHDFSAGLIIGGKDLKFERKRLDQCNIMICTPGRLLQHMDENPLFDCVNMQILILDEADRCLDMGFEQTMNAIIANLPPQRQTLLFSATQTKSVKDLARLSLKDPSYVSVHENSQYSTPDGLEQSYVICELHDKIPIIWSFIRNHLKQKCIIFLSSCKEVKYIFEMFCKLRPGISIMALYGSLHQLRRISIYEEFCQKNSAVLFATDLASRGLDFPKVHWVVQADCPEDTDTYIHRVGRTARFHTNGESLLLLLPSEISMVEKLQQRKIPINKIEINPSKLQNPVRKMEAFLARDPALKDTAQRAFVSYVKAIFLMKDKNVFDVHSLETDSFAKSLGLAIPPRIRFLQRLNAKKFKENVHYEETESNDTADSIANPFDVSDDSDNEEDVFKVKRKNHDIELPVEPPLEELNLHKSGKNKVISKVAAAKKILRKKIAPNKKIVFNDDGESIKVGTKEKRSELAQAYENENEGGIDIEKAKMVLKEEDKFDKQLFKEKVKIKHREQKLKLKQKRKLENQEEKDDFGGDSDGEEPDLSWLPDPDKIYGKRRASDGSDNENDGIDDNGDSDDNETNSPSNQKPIDNKIELELNSKSRKRSKRKLLNKEETSSISVTKKKKHNIAKADALSINEAEELAMMLLKSGH